jgi:general secretion pathway protein A
LRDPKLQQFAQRISYEYFLTPLDSCDLVRDYVRYRIDNAGGDPDIFEEETYAAIWTATGGVPRLINLLCDTASDLRLWRRRAVIGLATVARVVIDKHGAFGQNLNEPPSAAEGSKPHSKHRRSTVANQRTGMSTIERAAQRKRDDR